MIDNIVKKINDLRYYSYALSLMSWDQMTGAPRSGGAYRSEAMQFLSKKMHEEFTSSENGKLIDEALASNPDEITRRAIEIFKKAYDENIKLPSSHVEKFTKASIESSMAWEEAKENNDYSHFEPHLSRIIDLLKERASLLGHKDTYNYLLDIYEEGMNTTVLDEFFETLKIRIIPLLQKIIDAGKPLTTSYTKKNVPVSEQELLTKRMLEVIGFNYGKGMVRTSTHPFTMGLHVSDVRLTTKYIEDMPFSSVYSTIHEGGHAIYEQNISPEYSKFSTLSNITSLGLHESQSKIYETVFGLNRNFVHFLAKELEKLPSFAEGVDGDELYKELNYPQSSLIRTEADELTYPLHIIIRYEVEKAIFSGQVTTKDLPSLWNKKYKEYLGIDIPSDSEGILQDMHWSDGSMGYFPTYSIGTAYALQIANTMKKDFNYEEDLLRGDFSRITAWLNKNVHMYGAYYKPLELLEKVTGEKLNPEYFARYLEEKYSNIFNL